MARGGEPANTVGIQARAQLAALLQIVKMGDGFAGRHDAVAVADQAAKQRVEQVDGTAGPVALRKDFLQAVLFRQETKSRECRILRYDPGSNSERIPPV